MTTVINDGAAEINYAREQILRVGMAHRLLIQCDGTRVIWAVRNKQQFAFATDLATVPGHHGIAQS